MQVSISIEKIRDLIQNEGYNWTVAQSKAEFKNHLEKEGQLDQYLNEDGNLIRSSFTEAYEESEFYNRSIQEYYTLDAKGIIVLQNLPQIKEAKIRRGKRPINVTYNFVISDSVTLNDIDQCNSSNFTESVESTDLRGEEEEEEEEEVEISPIYLESWKQEFG